MPRLILVPGTSHCNVKLPGRCVARQKRRPHAHPPVVHCFRPSTEEDRGEDCPGAWGLRRANMAREGVREDLPTTDARRVQLRDAKMWRRETERQIRTGEARSRCPCSLCLFGRPLLRSTHGIHLRDFGRHPMRRLQPQVTDLASLSCVLMQACSLGGRRGRCSTPRQCWWVCASNDHHLVSGGEVRCLGGFSLQ